MEIFFEKDSDYDVYKKYYYPLLVRQGFSWRMFPELSIYLDLRYPGWTGGINSDTEHFNPNNMNIFVRMITEQEWIQAGNDPALYDKISKHYPSSLAHEIMHYIHTKHFGADGSKTWLHALALIGETPNFKAQNTGSYWWKPSYEAIANYFEACIEGRKKDAVFMSFILGLFGIKYRIYTSDDYVITKDRYGLDRAHVPIRLITETFKDGILRDIDWLEATREVVVISGAKGF